MSKWQIKALGELGVTYTGLTGKTIKDFGYGKPFIPYLNIFGNSKIDTSFLNYVHVNPWENQNVVRKGDFFFTTSSETVEEVGMTSVLLDDISECYLNSFCFGFRLFSQDDLLPEFACYLFRGPIVRKNISDLGQGSTRYNLPKTELLKRLKLLLPTKEEQLKITKILSTTDAILEKTKQAIAKYKAIKQGMLHDLFTRGIDTKTGKLRTKYEDAPELYKKSKLGWVPKEWDVEPFSNAFDIISGGTPSTHNKAYWNGNIPWLSVDDFNNGKRYVHTSAKRISEAGLKNSATNLLTKDMIIISARGTVGVISQLGTTMAFNQSCYGFNSINKKITNDFGYYFLIHYKTYFGFSGFGSVFSTITRDYFDTLEIAYPKNENETLEIVKRVSLLDGKIETEQAYLHKIQQIKQGLMSDLLSGKKRVKVEENKK